MQTPFQYSLHAEHADGTLEHREFLAHDGIDSRELLAQKLGEDIPRDVTVLAYNMGFEKGVIKKFASNYPELSEHLLHVSQNSSQAMNAYTNMLKLDSAEKEKMRNSLLQYCKLDTMAMVRVLWKLKTL